MSASSQSRQGRLLAGGLLRQARTPDRHGREANALDFHDGEAMSMAYIRETYGVPAKRGGRVEYLASDGELMEGTITGSSGAYLLVRLDGAKYSGRYHPTWALKYLPDGPTFNRRECESSAAE